LNICGLHADDDYSRQCCMVACVYIILCTAKMFEQANIKSIAAYMMVQPYPLYTYPIPLNSIYHTSYSKDI